MSFPSVSAGLWLVLKLAQGLAIEVEAIGIVDDTVEDGVGERRLGERGRALFLTLPSTTYSLLE